MTYIEERTYFPDGMHPDDVNAHAFQVGVYYRGYNKWCVARSREASYQMTHTGRWLWLPAKMTALRWCRFDFETACELAEKHVNHRKVNGRTWAEWKAKK